MNFRISPDYSGVNAYKIDGQSSVFDTEGLYPHWVADMDFVADKSIINALAEVVERGLYVYNTTPAEYYPSISNWIREKQSWIIENEWICSIPGVVRGLSYAIHYFSKPGDKIIIQSPVYHPFRLLTVNNDREVVYNPLFKKISHQSGRAEDCYSMDLDFLRSLKKGSCKLLVLCNPHNPIGLKWSRDTLLSLAEICYEKGILVLSDEIHADLCLWDETHIPFASVSEKAAEITVTFGAPSKTFNIPGLQSSYIITPNPKLREGFYQWLRQNEYSSLSIFATRATIAAYTKAERWRDRVIKEIEKNILFMEDFFRRSAPQIKPIRPQASFLVWLDCRSLHLNQNELMSLFIEAGLAVNDGSLFGKEGEGFIRFNVATPTERLTTSLNQLLLTINSKKERGLI